MGWRKTSTGIIGLTYFGSNRCLISQ